MAVTISVSKVEHTIDEVLRKWGVLDELFKEVRPAVTKALYPRMQKDLLKALKEEARAAHPRDKELYRGIRVVPGGGGRGHPAFTVMVHGPAAAYARALNEEETIIRPKRWKNLTIPLEGAEKRPGRKKKTPWDFPSDETFTVRIKRTGDLIMFRKKLTVEQKFRKRLRKMFPHLKKTRKGVSNVPIIPLFLLVKQHTIYGSMWADAAYIKFVKGLTSHVSKAIDDYFDRKERRR